MKRNYFLVLLVMMASAANAQEHIKVGEILDLEERVLIKRMNEELEKPSPNAPPAAPIIVVSKPAPIIYPTETLAVYGTSATYYEGQLSIGGRVHTVRLGSPVQGYVVSSIAPHGIGLTKSADAPVKGKRKAQTRAAQALFAPLVAK